MKKFMNETLTGFLNEELAFFTGTKVRQSVLKIKSKNDSTDVVEVKPPE